MPPPHGACARLGLQPPVLPAAPGHGVAAAPPPRALPALPPAGGRSGGHGRRPEPAGPPPRVSEQLPGLPKPTFRLEEVGVCVPCGVSVLLLELWSLSEGPACPSARPGCFTLLSLLGVLHSNFS